MTFASLYMFDSIIEDLGFVLIIFVAFIKMPESIIVETISGLFTIVWISFVHINEAIPPAETPATIN